MKLPKISLAQVLLFPAALGICLGCAMELVPIWLWRFPSFVLDVRLSDGAARLVIARGEAGRFCVLSCDTETGLVRRLVEVKNSKWRDLQIASDCDTWAALYEDGQLEFGRIESGERWTVRTSLRPGARLHHLVFDQPGRSELSLSRNGRLCVAYSDREISLVDIEGRKERRAIKMPAVVIDARPSHDGSRVLVVCEGNPNGIHLLINVENGKLAVVPALDSDPWSGWDWAADGDIVLSESTAVADFSVADGQLQRSGREHGYRLANSSEAVERESLSPSQEQCAFAVGRGGSVCAFSSNNVVHVIGVPDLTPRYRALRMPNPFTIKAVSVSGDGRTVAAADPWTIFIADMKEGTARALAPFAGGRGLRSFEIVLPSAVLLAVCIWLFWRARPHMRAEDVSGASLKTSLKKTPWNPKTGHH